MAVVAAVPVAIGAAWGVVQIVETIANWHLNREILELQRDKLKQELHQTFGNYPEFIERGANVREELRLREGTYYYDRTAERLKENPNTCHGI